MINFKKILNLSKIKNLQKIPWLLGSYAFLFILALILLDVIIGEIVFYKYGLSVIEKENQTSENLIKLKESSYQGVLNYQENKNQYFNKLIFGQNNPFKNEPTKENSLPN